MSGINGLVPARFLCLIAHLVITVVILLSREGNVLAGLPLRYTQEEYDQKDMELLIGLSVALALITIELIGFLGGITMFMPTQGMISTLMHASAAVGLAYFLFDGWEIWTYWYIFGFCCAFPAVSEIFVIIGVTSFNKGL